MLEVVDIDPTKIETFETEVEEDSNYDDSVDMDTDDIIIEDGSLVDENTKVSVKYEDGTEFASGVYLSVYPLTEDDLSAMLLELIGDKKYLAYDLGLAMGTEFIDQSGALNVRIPLPEGFDPELTFLYALDIYGDVYAVDYELDRNAICFTTEVLGTFILVEGELPLPEDPDSNLTDSKPSSKNNKKDTDKSNGWTLWVWIAVGGGVVLLAGAAVVLLFVMKKRKAAK
jgi:hypothetical protein